MIKKNQKATLKVILMICTSLCACSKPLDIYIDIKKQAIVSCSGEGLKRIRIENDSTEVTLEGTAASVYFNNKNDARTSIYGDIVYDYILKLRPNCKYKVKKDNGYDRGPITITFKTDNAGKVIEASSENCNY